ncbi:MAG: MFS transporter [Deltaproteobacteria bacterium]|nr:MFS transporter [Deltaproteobacteria bacterium]
MTRTERTYYLVFGLYCVSWSLIAPVYPLFLLSRGLDLLQINLVLATYLLTSFLFEVPTGALADRFGRKRAFLLSCIIRAGAFVLYWFADSFTDCLIAEACDALGTTLANGALDAWAVDGMHAEGNRRPADRFFARAQMIARTLMIAGGLAGGYLGEHDLALTWPVAAAGFAVTALVAQVWMRDGLRPERATEPVGSVAQTMRAGLRIVRQAPALLLMCVLTGTAAFGIMPVHMMWQPRFQQLTGEGAWLMGWIWALINVAAIAGSALIARASTPWAREHALGVVTLCRGAMLAVAALASSVYPALLGLLAFELCFGFGEPLIQAWMNDHIGREQRATILSVRAMSFTLGGGIGLACIGLIARDLGIQAAWVVSAAMLVLTAPGFFALARLVRRPGASPASAAAANVASVALS